MKIPLIRTEACMSINLKKSHREQCRCTQAVSLSATILDRNKCDESKMKHEMRSDNFGAHSEDANVAPDLAECP